MCQQKLSKYPSYFTSNTYIFVSYTKHKVFSFKVYFGDSRPEKKVYIHKYWGGDGLDISRYAFISATSMLFYCIRRVFFTMLEKESYQK